MRYLLILSLLFISCTDEDDYHVDPEPDPVMSLTISNQHDDISIKEVSLVGYEFENISIDYGQARTFTLDNGINGGLTGVNINVKFRCGGLNWSGGVSKNFFENQNTTVTIVDCFANGQGGCTEVCYQ